MGYGFRTVASAAGCVVAGSVWSIGTVWSVWSIGTVWSLWSIGTV
ncbi:hypothetical protein [Streptomyces hawaiiensis]